MSTGRRLASLFAAMSFTLVLEPGAVSGSQVVSVDCGEGVTLRASDPELKQGAVGLLEVRSDRALEGVTGSVGGRTLEFWHGAESRVFQALVGVDLYEPPGSLGVSTRAVSGTRPEQPVLCGLEIRVVDGGFAVQKLSVAPKFVELSERDLARSRRENSELARIFESTTPERLWRGGFESPVPGYSASGSFGKRRVFNDEPRNPHSGEDFSAPAGAPVRAPARARVALAKSLFFLGNTVVLDHGFGLYSFFGHLSAIEVEPGALVETGTVVGRVGATGRVTGAHLHWGVRLADARVNPMDLLALAGGN